MPSMLEDRVWTADDLLTLDGDRPSKLQSGDRPSKLQSGPPEPRHHDDPSPARPRQPARERDAARALLPESPFQRTPRTRRDPLVAA